MEFPVLYSVWWMTWSMRCTTTINNRKYAGCEAVLTEDGSTRILWNASIIFLHYLLSITSEILTGKICDITFTLSLYPLHRKYKQFCFKNSWTKHNKSEVFRGRLHFESCLGHWSVIFLIIIQSPNRQITTSYPMV
jgi:hypothetical protein